MLTCKIIGGKSYCKKLSFLSKEFAIITFPNTSSILHVTGISQIYGKELTKKSSTYF
jgi:hypothetical protein